MNIQSAEFKKSIINPQEMYDETLPQIVFLGRSNVGKSSLINALTKQKNLARTSSFPGHTKCLNLFLINKKGYFVDLPGYGFARASSRERDGFYALINKYLFGAIHHHKVVLVLDAKVGPTKDDLETVEVLRNHNKDVVVVLNKIDKLKSSESEKQIQSIKQKIGDYVYVSVSTKTKKGIQTLLDLLSF